MSSQPDPAADLAWFDARAIGVEGKGWPDTERCYGRLPARVRPLVRDRLWRWGRESAGLCVHFETDAPDVWARWTLEQAPVPALQEARLSHAGLDLYARDARGRWRWAGVGAPSGQAATTARLNRAPLDPAMRRFRLYLPLRAALESLEIGVPRGTTFRPVPPRPDRPIVFYGTSIVHGGSASRAGMAHAAILGRRFERPVLNLGFSGEGQMDPPLVDLLCELDPCVYVVDCLPNMGPPLVRERAEPLLRRLRAARPRTPIVLVEDRTLATAAFNEAVRDDTRAKRAALREAYDRLVREGAGGLYYVEGESLFGGDGDATADASHPSDLGYWRMAEALEPVLGPLV